MHLSSKHYVPCLRWKLGEYQAMQRISILAKKSLTPLIEVPEVGFDFETQTESKSLDDHLKKFPKRVSDKWGKREFFLDICQLDSTERLANGEHILSFLFRTLRDAECSPIPVITPTESNENIAQVANQVRLGRRNLCIRISLEELFSGDTQKKISSLEKNLSLSTDDCHVIVDLKSPNFDPIDSFSRVVVEGIQSIPNLKKWGSVVLLGTSFPETMGDVEFGNSIIPRYEWMLFKLVSKALTEKGVRVPTFGDYAINHPKVNRKDPRKVKPAASIRYTIDDGWFIIKGKNVRDFGLEQYQYHCLELIESGLFLGSTFSYADDYIEKCSQGLRPTGNLSTWRWIGTNHHFEKVTQDISGLPLN